MSGKRKKNLKTRPSLRPLGLFKALGLTAAAAFIFYRSAWGMLAGIALVPIIIKRELKREKGKREIKILREFESMIQAVSGALGAGYSLERAFAVAESEVKELYGRKSLLAPGIESINKKVRLNEPIDDLFYKYARETGIEELMNFAEIMKYAKRSGGNMNRIIRDTIERMSEKAAVIEEIEAQVASRRTEQKLLNFMLPGILLFMSLSSPDYMDFLYTGVFGAAFMSICLALYAGVILWSEKMVDIEV